ncbi:MAG: 2,4-dihydroxyhept-2-ene-1,7-dioic acid aldolase, partial [Bacteroidota bacterium]|nr:2,4-dihydroxyhept-2-ene-1,7-dioic acid aldolase [Bacteroidota bacterium]
FLIGPNDLSGSMGIPRQLARKEYKDAVERVKEAGLVHGIMSGVHVVEPNVQEFDSAIKDGFKFVAYSLDTRVLDVGFREVFKQRKTK